MITSDEKICKKFQPIADRAIQTCRDFIINSDDPDGACDFLVTYDEFNIIKEYDTSFCDVYGNQKMLLGMNVKVR